ncbi:MAG: PqqD family protein [Anaeromyxobacter sp.]
MLLTELADGTGVLLHLRTKFYYALNATGVVVWKLLASGEAATLEALAAAVVARFQGAEEARARADVSTLLAELQDEGLLLPAAPASAAPGEAR